MTKCIFLFFYIALILIESKTILHAEDLCPTNENLAEDILNKITPAFSAVTSPALFKQFPSKRVEGGYQTKLGIIVESSCLLEKNPKDKEIEERNFEETLQKILENAKRCGERRLMSSALQLFYGAIKKMPRISCDRTACTSKAAACADVKNNRITIRKFSNTDKNSDSRFDQSLWFHELLHLAKIDNQTVEDHNHADESGGTTDQDEVYYWQRTCFSPDTILRNVRYESEDCLKKNISIDDCKLEACLMPFQINNSTYRRFNYNKKEIELSCLFYKTYLKNENLLQRSIDSVLAPEILTCEKNAKGTLSNCPNFSVLSKKSTESKVLSRFMPPTQLSRHELKVWAEKSCATYSSISQMSEDLIGCAYSISRNLEKVEGSWQSDIQDLINKKIVTEEEMENLSIYWKNVVAKGSFVASGPQKYSDFPSLKTKSELTAQLARSLKICNLDFNTSIPIGLNGTELCRKYKLFVQEKEAALLKEWE